MNDDSTTAAAETPTGEDPALLQAQTERKDAAGADNAEAEAAAKAEAEYLAGDKAAKPKRSRKAPELNLEALSNLTRTIDMLNTTGHRLGLVDELRQVHGAQIAKDEDEGVTVEIAGIKTVPADTMETALTNWSNAARRVILEATA